MHIPVMFVDRSSDPNEHGAQEWARLLCNMSVIWVSIYRYYMGHNFNLGCSCRSAGPLLTPVLLNPDIPAAFANSVDPDQLASEEANWSGSALFAIKYMNTYQQSGSSNLCLNKYL